MLTMDTEDESHILDLSEHDLTDDSDFWLECPQRNNSNPYQWQLDNKFLHSSPQGECIHHLGHMYNKICHR